MLYRGRRGGTGVSSGRSVDMIHRKVVYCAACHAVHLKLAQGAGGSIQTGAESIGVLNLPCVLLSPRLESMLRWNSLFRKVHATD